MSLPNQSQIESAIATGGLANLTALFVDNPSSTGTMTGSVRCQSCANCTDCVDCANCSSSSNLIRCTWLTTSADCEDCDGQSANISANMVRCVRVDKSDDCVDCYEISNSQYCVNCRGDARVTGTGNKYNKLYQCKDLLQCSRCMFATGLVGADRMIGNVQVSAATFNAAWALTGR